MAKKEQNAKFKKAPGAPRRFKSAYMFFSTEKHKSIRQEHGKKLQTTEVAKMVSQAWKDLPSEEREEWEEMARRDKRRYEVEKTMYTGPWKVPANKSRSQKDPNAPKRPMSAFLSYSNSKRAAVKARNPEIGNAEVSRILAKMWKEAPEEERKLHIEKEFELRQEYKSAIAIWRQNADEELKAARKKREDIALQQVDSPDNSYHHPPPEAASVDIADESTTDPGSPKSMVGSAAGPPSAAPMQLQMGAFGMGFNPTNIGCDSSGCSPQFPSSNYGSFAPPTSMGVAAGMSCGPREASGMYGMMQAGAFSEGCFSADYGMNSNCIDPSYDASMNMNSMNNMNSNNNMMGFHGGYYHNGPQASPQMQMPGTDPTGGMWGGQYYGNGSAQYNTTLPDGSLGNPNYGNF